MPAHADDATLAQTSTGNSGLNQKGSFIDHFDNGYISYFGGYKNFGKGYYGIGAENFSESGSFFNFSWHGCYGIIDPGEMQFRIGGGYGYAPMECIAFTGRLNALFGTATKYEIDKKTGKLNDKSVFAYGILFAPGIRLKLSKFVFGVNFDLGWAYMGASGFYKDVELTLGYDF